MTNRFAVTLCVALVATAARAQNAFNPGDIVVADPGNGRLARVDPVSGAISNIGTVGATSVAVDPAGNLVTATSPAGHNQIHRIDAAGNETSITTADLPGGFFRGVAVDPASGTIY